MIPPKLIDIKRPSGCRPRETAVGEEWPVFSDTGIDLIPRGEWRNLLRENVSLEKVVGSIKNQKNEGSCASNATTQCFEIVWNMMLGPKHWIQMSPISIYRFVADGPNSGSTIDSNLRRLRDVGCLPSKDGPDNSDMLQQLGLDINHRLKNVGYYQQFPHGWEQTAKHFRALEWFEIQSFDEFVTCLFMDFPVCYGRAGHAITGVTPVLDGSTWHVKYANSWGDWGDGGYGFDSEGFISGSISSYGAWGLRSVVWPTAIDA